MGWSLWLNLYQSQIYSFKNFFVAETVEIYIYSCCDLVEINEILFPIFSLLADDTNFPVTQVDKTDTNLDEVVAEGAYEDTHEEINPTDNNLHSEEVRKNIIEDIQIPENILFIHQNELHNQSVKQALGSMRVNMNMRRTDDLSKDIENLED